MQTAGEKDDRKETGREKRGCNQETLGQKDRDNLGEKVRCSRCEKTCEHREKTDHESDRFDGQKERKGLIDAPDRPCRRTA